MGHNSVVLGHPKSTRILRVDRLSIGPLDLGCHISQPAHSTYRQPRNGPYDPQLSSKKGFVQEEEDGFKAKASRLNVREDPCTYLICFSILFLLHL